MDIFVRNLTEKLRRLAWWYDHEQQGQFSAEIIHTYNAAGFGPSTAKQGGLRDPGNISTIVVHVTGVTKGFGASKKAVQKWTHIAPPGMDRLTAKQRAVAERFRMNVPYHTVGMRDCFVLHSREYNQRTYHAGKYGNAYIGCCLMDCHPNEKLTVREVFTARKALAETFYKLRGFGRTDRKIRVISHSQVASPSRRGNDPGSFMWNEVVRPICNNPEFDGMLVTDELFSAGQGQPIKW